MKNNAQLSKELRLLKERMEQFEASKSSNDNLNSLSDVQPTPQPETNVSSGDNSPNDNKPSLFSRLKAFIIKHSSKVYDFLVKFNILIYLKYLRIAIKLQLIQNIILAILLILVKGYNLFDAYVHIVHIYEQVYNSILTLFSNMYNTMATFISTMLTQSTPVEISKWPDLDEHLKRKKDITEDTRKAMDIINKQNYISDSLINEYYPDTNHWYDFMKSPWFYIPVTTLSVGLLVYYNLDSIQSFFNFSKPSGPSNPSIPNTNPTDLIDLQGLDFTDNKQVEPKGSTNLTNDSNLSSNNSSNSIENTMVSDYDHYFRDDSISRSSSQDTIKP